MTRDIDSAVDLLKRDILQGRFVPGQRLVEIDIMSTWILPGAGCVTSSNACKRKGLCNWTKTGALP